jgi:hypothetical protein
MIATKYLYAIAALLAIALVPTVIHSYVELTASDGRVTQAVASTLDGVAGTDTKRAPIWVRENFGAEDFIERRYADTTLFVARSYDLKGLYHHPELGAAYGRSYDTHRVQQVSTPDGPVAMHVLTGTGGLACYVLLYDREYVADPLLFHAKQALVMLFSPRRPMTLFFAHGPASSAPTESPAARLVLAALQSFLAQPSTGS